MGVAYDGDSDRLGIVNHRGEPVFGDKLLIIFAREILSRPGTTFVSEVKCSKTLYDDIEKRGGRAIMARTGSLPHESQDEGSGCGAGGGDERAHVLQRPFFRFRRWHLCSCRILEILANSSKTIPELLEGIPETFTTPEIRWNVQMPLSFRWLKEPNASLKKGAIKSSKSMELVSSSKMLGMVRASNTQPVLVLRYEADTAERLEEIRRMVESAVEKPRASRDLLGALPASPSSFSW